jgi:hypothetical protein
MPLKVIGAGLGRTGTLSLKAALEELGFGKCYHMVEVLANPKQSAAWTGAANGERTDWEALFKGYQSTVDWPACNFYQELARRYPEAKVILSVRDPDRWYESARQTIYFVREAFPRWTALVLPRMRVLRRMLDRLIWDGMFHGRFEDRPYAISVFNRHNEEVRRVVPSDRLLVYDIKDGWQPLCLFLGVPVPDGKPFPHLNDAAEFRTRIGRAVWIMRFGAAAMLLFAILVLVVTSVIAYLVVRTATVSV